MSRPAFLGILVLSGVVSFVDVHADDVEDITERDVDVPMRDGVILRANVFRPASGGPSPVLVMRTPYGKAPVGSPRLGRARRILFTRVPS